MERTPGNASLRPSVSRAGVLAIGLILGAVAACSDGEPTGPGDPPDDLDDVLLTEEVTHDPSGHAPLTALIRVETEVPVFLGLRVVGRNGAASDVRHRFPSATTGHEIPVLGLYPDHENTVELTFHDEAGGELGTRSYTVTTPPLSEHMPSITVDRAVPSEMAEGMTRVSYYGHGGDASPNRPFIFDHRGEIRWVLDYEGHPQLGELAYGDGVHRLRNGNLYFGDGASNRIYEVDMLGRIVESWDLPGYSFHHEVTEKPNGNLLVLVSKKGIATIEDHVIEIGRESGEIVNTWDLRESLDQDRDAWTDDLTDWFHANAITYDESDGTIIVSGRTQGVVKLTEANEVVWILAPHRGWGTAGDGTDLAPRLLQPLDASGAPITDLQVLSGDENHPDFQWSWYQHAAKVTVDGSIVLFDNGANRNYTGAETYSRAVEYEIDPEELTIQQVWAYGESRGTETYAPIVSDVDFGGDEGHVFFSPGAVTFMGSTYGKVLELDHPGKEVLFEATITPPEPIFIITFHRTERLPLYPGE